MLETVFLEELVFHQLVISLLLLCLNVVVIVNEIDFLADVPGEFLFVAYFASPF